MEINFKIRIVLCFCLGVFFTSCNQNTEFDSEVWKRNGGEGLILETRYNMVDDLIDSEVLLNKSSSEVEGLIGAPSSLRNEENNNYKYYIVQERYGSDIDPEELVYLKVRYNEVGFSESVDLYSTK